MLKWKPRNMAGDERGDTLIEVTIALSILSFVLLGSTAIAATAFRIGQTARERTQVSEVAQEQMEALRSFRDDHTWAEFQGGGPGYQGIDAVAGSFHMELTTIGAVQWVPIAGSLKPSTAGSTLTVPTSVITLSTTTNPLLRGCGYDFLLNYQFSPLGGGVNDTNQIATRLSNLKYSHDPILGPAPCP